MIYGVETEPDDVKFAVAGKCWREAHDGRDSTSSCNRPAMRL
jgi:hypothetical protein